MSDQLDHLYVAFHQFTRALASKDITSISKCSDQIDQLLTSYKASKDNKRAACTEGASMNNELKEEHVNEELEGYFVNLQRQLEQSKLLLGKLAQDMESRLLGSNEGNEQMNR